MDYGIRCLSRVSEFMQTPTEKTLFQDIKTFAHELKEITPELQPTWKIEHSISLRNHASEMAWSCARADATQTRREAENICWAMAYLCSNFPIRAVMWANGADPHPKDGIRFQEETLFLMLTDPLNEPHIY